MGRIDMIRVLADKTRIAQYQRLLVSEWTKDLPDAVLSLLWSSLHSKGPADDPLFKLLNPNVNSTFPSKFFRSLLDAIGNASKFLHLGDLPQLPVAYDASKRLSKNAWQANRLAAYLTLQASTKFSGDVEFFRDLQAFAFQAAVHFVLPAIAEKHPAEHTILLHALWLFTLEYVALDPAHYCYLVGMLHGYLGNGEERLRFLQASFRLTRPEDHSFLTKAQEVWTELLDQGRYDEAEKFLFSLHWWALPGQQDEVREMMVHAFKHTLAQKRE